MDDEGCLLCHKYPKMGRVTDDGTRRSYYVLPHVFNKTVHRNVPCRDCHSYIEELPHKEVTTGVTCNSECHHVKNPATGKNFSHQKIYDAYQKSTHGRSKVEEGLEADKPYCITCHTNPLYNPDEAAPPEHITDRCVVCHEDQEFAQKWYNHTSRRIKDVKRSNEEIVALCSSCHGDEDLVERHMEAAEERGETLGEKFPVAVESYQKSFHGKVTHYGFKDSPDCLDCHADSEQYFLSVHELRPSRDPLSPVNEANVLETCQQCHVYADEKYATLDAHPDHRKEANPVLYYFEEIYGVVGNVVLVALVGLAMFETAGRRRDGVTWKINRGSSWRRRSKRGRNRVIDSEL
ncbi:MAG: hypothetical protein HUJ31_11405 [Pseudomonadales bacterium]|nr:hypothetical protein [Pseudomonadales bacterium]